VQTAELIVRSALLRKESRGLHYSRDYPDTLEETQETVLEPPHAGRTALFRNGTRRVPFFMMLRRRGAKAR
jgi:succinate dehydrogenase/fumarate reductase flavoprotein subunit